MAMEKHNLNFHKFTEKEEPYFDVIDCFHPFLESPIKNSYSFKVEKVEMILKNLHRCLLK